MPPVKVLDEVRGLCDVPTTNEKGHPTTRSMAYHWKPGQVLTEADLPEFLRAELLAAGIVSEDLAAMTHVERARAEAKG